VGGPGLRVGWCSVVAPINLLVALIAWDLDHFTRDYQQFSVGQARESDDPALFKAHLKRLGIVAMLGWSLGVVALNVQFSLNFASALTLSLLALLSLRQIVRYLGREGGYEEV
jgi:hypothetical protein